MEKVWEQYNMTKEEWNNTSEEDREKLTGQDWHTEPCSVCGKPTLVMGEVYKVLCMEHGEEK